VERAGDARVIGVFAPAPLAAAGVIELDEDGAHHLRVRRAAAGDEVRVTDGRGVLGFGRVARLEKRTASVDVERLERVERPAPLQLLVPVADRDRMLLVAEKAVELGLASWQPVVWRRSLSVSPRGEGEAFRAKVVARMTAALLQSGGAWLPEVLAERPLAAVATSEAGESVLLDAVGPPLLALDGVDSAAPLRLVVGPEGGVEPDERALLLAAGFEVASLGARVLRFETAAVVGLGVVQAARAAAARQSAARLTPSTDAP
jgi:16S rRNA (uracil1498-N3)-methyltransferase